MLGLMFVMVACVDAPDSGEGDDAVPCSGESVQVAVAETAMPTVLRLTWTTPAESVGQVVFSGEGQVERWSATTLGTEHEVLLVGLRPASLVSYSVLVDGERACGGSGTASTGALEVTLPSPEVRVATPGAADAGLTVVPLIGNGGSGAAILDEGGAIVWAAQLGGGGGRPVYRAVPSLDGEAVLFNESADGSRTPGVLYRVSLDGEVGASFDVPGGHTDFVEWAPREYAMLGWEIRDFDGRRLMGDTIIEFDEEGNSTVVWSVFDSLTPDLSETYDLGWYPDDPTVEDWTHVNSLAYSPDEDAYYVTMTLDDGVARVDRSTGEMTWLMGTAVGDFETPDGQRLFARPHSVQPLDGLLVVFNRFNAGREGGSCAHSVEVAYDPAAGTAASTWAYEPDDCVEVEWLGSAQRLAGGSTLSCFSSAGRLDEVDDDGTLVLNLTLSAGNAFGFAHRIEEPAGSFPRDASP